MRARPCPCHKVTRDPFAFSTKTLRGSQSCSHPCAPDPRVPVSPYLCVSVSLGPHVLSLSSLHSCGFNPWASASPYLCIHHPCIPTENGTWSSEHPWGWASSSSCLCSLHFYSHVLCLKRERGAHHNLLEMENTTLKSPQIPTFHQDWTEGGFPPVFV